jgi:hypothetical protein
MSEPATEPLRFDARIGGVLVAPRRTFARLAAGEARAGDVLWLLLLRLVAGELDLFARAVRIGREVGIAYGVQTMLVVVSTVLPDVVVILVAGILMSLFAPRATRTFDVAAYAWIPYLTVELAGALYYTARAELMPDRVYVALQVVGIVWATIVWAIALVALRRRPT